MTRTVTIVVVAGLLLTGCIVPAQDEPEARVSERDDSTQDVSEPEDDIAEPEPESESPQPDRTLNAEDQQDLFRSAIEGDRSNFIAHLDDTDDIERTDRLDTDLDDGSLIVAVTSRWSTPDNQREGAWATARELAVWWGDDAWEDIEDTGARDPVWWPALSLDVSGILYECDGQTMRRVAERRISRAEWEAACQG